MIRKLLLAAAIGSFAVHNSMNDIWYMPIFGVFIAFAIVSA